MSAKEDDVDKGADNSFMNLFALRKTNSFAAKPLDACPQGQMIPFDFLRILFSGNQLFSRNPFLIGKVIVRINLADGKRFKEGEKLIQMLMFPRAKCKRQRCIRRMINCPP